MLKTKSAGWLVVLLAALHSAQPAEAENSLRSDVLYLLPAESSFVAFVDLQALRASPHYEFFRERLRSRRVISYERFLKSLGLDPEKDLDWVAWVRIPLRANPAGAVLGIARGRLSPERAEQFFLQQRLPVDAYRGQTLFPYRGELGAQDFFLAFLDSTTVAFGNRAGLQLMLETRFGSRPNLLQSQALAERLNRVNGRVPAWGVFDSQSTPGVVRGMLPELAEFPEYRGVAESFRGSLLQISLGPQVSVIFQVVCRTSTSAQAFSHLLQTGLLAQSWEAQAKNSTVSALFSRVEVRSGGEQVEARATLTEGDLAALLGRPR